MEQRLIRDSDPRLFPSRREVHSTDSYPAEALITFRKDDR